MLQGYKTYIVAAITVVITILHSLGKIDDSTFQTLLALLGSSGAMTLSAKINRLNEKMR